jgi:hypothetical protein
MSGYIEIKSNSKEIQEYLFSLGYDWKKGYRANNRFVVYPNLYMYKYLYYWDSDKSITWSNKKHPWETIKLKELYEIKG